jgi:murein L,D-transpeptidase YcbB/YkuD
MFHMDKLITLDLLLTDAFLTYGIHALNGRVHPEAIRAQWFTERQQADPVVVLRHGLETQRVDEALRTLLPQEGGYYRLRQALTHYRLLASRGGWPQIAAGPIIQLGDHDPRVKTLRHRLRITGDLPVPASTESKESDGFDEALAKAVRRFQQRHGMEADGIVGPLTLAALNVPVEARVRQIAVNMERWRWLPHHLGQRYILVNIARFTLEVIEDGKSTLNMRIIVGKPYQSTPVFNATMTHLVVNPSWYVPASIAKEELLPVFRRDPDYLIRHNMRVSLSGVGEINPRSINWLQVSAANFPYRLRQVPGPKNPLGRVKFLFPNQFSVYLHDTSNPELFARPVRTFSHGCIRIEKPLDLAEYVLRGDSSWDRHKLQRAMVHGGERTIFLPTAIPVYLLYWTAWVEEDGVVHFRDDIYQRDTPLEKALFASLMTF